MKVSIVLFEESHTYYIEGVYRYKKDAKKFKKELEKKYNNVEMETWDVE